MRECQPINGGWSSWSRWSACSATCGRGSILRKRTCSNPRPQHGGESCPGETIQKRPCYLKKCQFEDTTDKESDCKDLPHVYGFLGPEKIGNKAKYTCYHGKVLDAMTNRREFYLPCNPGLDYKYPEEWPECHEPKYCIGPAQKNLNGLRAPFPIRDIPIMQDLVYSCDNDTLTASCFMDGTYRYALFCSETFLFKF